MDFSLEIMEILNLVAVLLGSIFAVYGIAFLRRKGIWEVIKQKEIFALLAVRFVEEFYAHLDGPEKLDRACEWAAAQLKRIGIKTTKEEILGIVLAMLREIKDEFGEEWVNHTDEKIVALKSGKFNTVLTKYTGKKVA